MSKFTQPTPVEVNFMHSDKQPRAATIASTADTSTKNLNAAQPPNTPQKRRDFGLFYKLGSIALLCVGFLVGMVFVEDLVRERQDYQADAIRQIKQSTTSEQRVITPFIVLPSTKTYRCEQYDEAHQRNITANCEKHVGQIITPASSSWVHELKVRDDEHYIGMYNAISYHDELAIDAMFDVSAFHPTTNKHTFVQHSAPSTPALSKGLLNGLAAAQTLTGAAPEESKKPAPTAKLILSLSDLEGLKDLPSVSINGKRYSFDVPKDARYLGLSYVELDLPDDMLDSQNTLTMHFDVRFKGIESLVSVPLGKQLKVALNANWPDPKFFGMSAQDKHISQLGTKATWFNTYTSIANTQALTACVVNNLNKSCQALDKNDSSFGLEFVSAVSAYTLTDRTIKYALLLLAVVFGAFFLFEITKNLRIHPVQYGLVAAALLVFYVLVLSLSEHIAFWQAYLSAAIACVSLLGWYVFYVLRSGVRAALFASILSALYTCFYVIIQSEGGSLVMGAVFMFVLLAAVMFFTRHIDWYKTS